ncbi:hypothetical protein V8E53_006026 [Lactarius tabidus]
MLCAERLRKPIRRGDADHSGAMVSPRDQVTSQKLQFGTNIIFWCIRSLIWLPMFSYRYIILPLQSAHLAASSSANYLTTGIDVDTIADGPERTKYGEWELYKKSEPNNSQYFLLATRS